MDKLKIVIVIGAILGVITGAKNSFSENIFKVSLISGFDSNYLEVKKNKKESIYSGFKFTNIFYKDNATFSSLTNFQFKNYSKSLIDFTQEFSFKIKSDTFYTGFIYYKDRNDEQNSFLGGYAQNILNLKYFDISYTLTYRKYLKNYIYGSYKHFIFEKVSNMTSKNLKKRKFQCIQKKEKDYFHDFNVKFVKFEDFTSSLGYTINSSNIKKEDSNSIYSEFEYSKYFNKFNYDIYLKIEKINYQKFNREDRITTFDTYIEYYFYKNYFISTEFTLKNNNSNIDDEDFKRFSIEFSIGVLF